MKKLMVLPVVVMLAGCVHWQDFNPFASTQEPPVPAVATTPVEKIGPDVIAVPVEPVEQEDMLPAAASAQDGL